MALSRPDYEELRGRGYLNVGRLFDDALLSEIAGEYDRLVSFDAQVLGNPEDGEYPYRAMLGFRSETLRACIVHPALLEIAVQVLGDDVRFWWDQGINKAPGSGSLIDWHQDNGYQRGRTQEYLTCWLALDDSTLENGGLEVVPGSHLAGPIDHEWHGVHAVIPDEAVDLDARVPLDARAGDWLLFSSQLVHRTVGNHTRDRQRRAWVVQYCRGDQHNETTGEIYDDRAWVVRAGVPVEKPWSERPFDLRRNA